MKDKFPFGIKIDTLNSDELAFIKKRTDKDNPLMQSFSIFLKLLRGLCFIPFIISEMLCVLRENIFKVFLSVSLVVYYAVNLSLMLLLNLPLYAYEACTNAQESTPSCDEFESNHLLTVN